MSIKLSFKNNKEIMRYFEEEFNIKKNSIKEKINVIFQELNCKLIIHAFYRLPFKINQKFIKSSI